MQSGVRSIFVSIPFVAELIHNVESREVECMARSSAFFYAALDEDILMRFGLPPLLAVPPGVS
jgi:hypothetical protein